MWGWIAIVEGKYWVAFDMHHSDQYEDLFKLKPCTYTGLRKKNEKYEKYVQLKPWLQFLIILWFQTSNSEKDSFKKHIINIFIIRINVFIQDICN